MFFKAQLRQLPNRNLHTLAPMMPPSFRSRAQDAHLNLWHRRCLSTRTQWCKNAKGRCLQVHQQAWSTRSQTCQVFDENVKVFPLKTNGSPLKINGWFRCIPYWTSPFLGNMLVFTGVVIAICGWLLFFGFDSFCFGGGWPTKIWLRFISKSHPLCVGWWLQISRSKETFFIKLKGLETACDFHENLRENTPPMPPRHPGFYKLYEVYVLSTMIPQYEPLNSALIS